MTKFDILGLQKDTFHTTIILGLIMKEEWMHERINRNNQNNQ